MELRAYYKKADVKQKLEEASIKPSNHASDDNPFQYRWGGFTQDDNDPELVYCTLRSAIEQLPTIIKGTEPEKVSLHAKLAAEQNQHIKQGSGKEGKSSWEIEFGSEKFAPSCGHKNFCMCEAFRAVINIWIYGSSIQSVLDCYDRIRQGKLGGEWQGSPSAIVATVNFDETANW